jgi:hypothetical protein
MASILLHKGLKKETEAGDLVYAFPQTVEGEDKVFTLVQDFTNQFQGIAIGLSVLYGSINGAMVVSGWFQGPDRVEEKPSAEIDPSKNLQTHKGRRKKSPSASVRSPRKN